MRLHLNQAAAHQRAHAEALTAGLRRHGVNAATAGPRIAVCWGWRHGAVLRAQGFDVLVLERGYVGDRFHFSSIGWNGLNGRAEFPSYPCDGGARFNALFPGLLRPWCPSGSYVLVAGQVPGDAALAGRNLVPWYAEQAQAFRTSWGLPVRFRPHPLAYKRGPVPAIPGAETIGGSMDEALAGAAVVVTFNSNLAVDATLAGKAVVAADPGSMVWDLLQAAGPQGPSDEARAAWAYQMAWKQWTMEEIRSGEALVPIAERIRGN